MQREEELTGSVNIQTDAVSFDKNKTERRSSISKETATNKHLKSQVSFKSRSSMLSGSAVRLPPAIYGELQKNGLVKRTESILSKPDTLNVSQALIDPKPDQINRLIQRDLARQAGNTSMGDHNLLLMPGVRDTSSPMSDSRGLLAPKPFPPTLHK